MSKKQSNPQTKPGTVTSPNVFSFIAYTLILFFGAIILANINPNANEIYRQERKNRNNKTMERIFITQNGKKHDIFGSIGENREHASAENWDYLLPEHGTSSSGSREGSVFSGSHEKEIGSGAVVGSGDSFSGDVVENAPGMQVNALLQSGVDRMHDDLVAPNDQQTGKVISLTESLTEEQIPQVPAITPAEEHATKEPKTESGSSKVLKKPISAYETLQGTLEDRSVFINMVFEYLLAGKIIPLPEGAVRYVVLLYNMDPEIRDVVFEEKSCMTPWGYEIDNGASVLAYQQRSDNARICNLERRVCRNGKLSGSFSQNACDEYQDPQTKVLPYATYNLDATVSNGKEVSEFVQPIDPVNKDAEFNMDGTLRTPDHLKIISETPETEYQDPASEVPQQQNPNHYCTTPWGEKVKSGQFTKSYRFKNGFVDIPCQVQLRVCVDGELEGHYQYATCQPRETSYEDFLYGYMNSEEPSPQRLLKMLRTEIAPDPEYGNNLSPEIIDQLLNILRE